MSDSTIRPPIPEEPNTAPRPLSVPRNPTDIRNDVRFGLNEGGNSDGIAPPSTIGEPEPEPNYDYLVRFFLGATVVHRQLVKDVKTGADAIVSVMPPDRYTYVDAITLGLAKTADWNSSK